MAIVPASSRAGSIDVLTTKGDLLTQNPTGTYARVAISGTSTDFLGITSGAPAWKAVAGGITLLSYVEFTSSVSVTATVEGSATTVVTAGAITADGTTLYCVEFYAPAIVVAAAANSSVIVNLFQDGTSIGRVAAAANGAGGSAINAPVFTRRYLTPSAGSRTFSIRAWQAGGNGAITAGAGGATSYLPGYIRVTSGT